MALSAVPRRSDGVAARGTRGRGHRGRDRGDELAKTTTVAGIERRSPARKPFPTICPRERVVIAAPTACTCCGSDRIVKMGEDITATLEAVPRQWKVIQTVREKFTCRACEMISQPPAPFYPTPRGWAGPNLLATILFEKFGQRQPLNRQAERYAREGVELSLSTLADQVGACAAALATFHALIRTHVLEAERLHGDDTTVPLLAKGGTRTARLWTMSATTDPSLVARRRPPCSTSRATGGWPTPTSISRDGRGSSRPMPTAVTTTIVTAGPVEQRALLEPCPPEVLRARRHQGKCPRGQVRPRHTRIPPAGAVWPRLRRRS